MKGRMLLFTAALGMAGATHANAQERPNTYVPVQRDHRAPALPTVQGFQPHSGPVGTQVTIHGTGFTPATELYVGGRPVPVLDVQPHTITFHVPSRYGNGFIELAHPRVRRPISVGRFTVVEPLQLASFTPRSGAPGARVEIHGHGFRPGDRVFLGRRALTIHALTPTRIVATIPAHAATDYLSIRRGNRLVERSVQVFQVQGDPVVKELWPQHGYTGSEIIIRGSGFGPRSQVFIGNRQVPLVRWSAKELVVRVPARVQAGRHWVRVRDGRAEARAPATLLVRAPLQITGFSPGRVEAGRTVELHGQGFSRDVRVFWGDFELPVRRVDRDGERLVVTMPSRFVGTHDLAVDDGRHRVQASRELRVVQPHGRIRVRDHRDRRHYRAPCDACDLPDHRHDRDHRGER